jgi:hypothetical protein
VLQGDALGEALGPGGTLVHALDVCGGDALGASQARGSAAPAVEAAGAACATGAGGRMG